MHRCAASLTMAISADDLYYIEFRYIQYAVAHKRLTIQFPGLCSLPYRFHSPNLWSEARGIGIRLYPL